MQGGHNLGLLAAPYVGHGAQAFSLIDAFTLDGIRQGLDGDVLTSCLWMGTDATGVELSGTDNGPLTDPQQCMDKMKVHANFFCASTLPD